MAFFRLKKLAEQVNVAHSSDIGSIVLAAGFSRRMGTCKALLSLADGQTFLGRLLSLHRRLATRCVVVLGHEADEIRAHLPLPLWVRNQQPERGPLSSLQLGLEALGPTRAVIVHPVDHPLVRSATLETLLVEHWRVPAAILIPEHCGRKGHPVLFPARFHADLMNAPLAVGARAVVRANSAAVHRVPVEDAGIIENVDTSEHYVRIRSLACGQESY